MRTVKRHLLSYSLLLLSYLPLSLLYLLSDFLFFILFRLVGYRTSVVDTNLRNAFPEKSAKERYDIKIAFYHFLADLIVECIKMRSISAAQAKKRWSVKNPEELYKYFDRGQSVILVNGHYGNWEWSIHCLSQLSQHPSLIVYKPLHDSAFEVVLNKMRSRFGAQMIPTKNTLRKIVSLKNTVHSSAFLADQTPAYGESDLFINFLNQETLVYKGIEKIAKLTGYPIIFCHLDREKRGHYSCEFTTLVENPKAYEENKITYIYNNFLEQIIREKPALWLWSHKRWKHRKTHESS